ncbi:MAG: porin family protein [Rhizobiales bacterium]|nr:porin family protein [Hyphomicrobiales bacterium]
MKICRNFAAAATMLALAGTAAGAADLEPDIAPDTSGFYLRADIGWSFLDWSDGDENDGIVAGAGFGYQFTDMLRADIRADFNGIDSVLGNVYLDIPTGAFLTPYLGAGAGYGWASVDNGKDLDGFAFALMAGVGFELTDSMTVDVGYRFRELMSSGSDPMSHEVLAGLRFEF